MNTNTNRRTVSIALTAAIVAGAILGTTNAANASEPRAQQPSPSIEVSDSFARPLAALGGRSLAEYLADHHARLVVTRV